MTIADIFATFYEELYTSTRSESDRPAQNETHNDDERITIPPFTMQELERELKNLKSGKASDQKGIIAEMVKINSHELRLVLLDLYNAILTPTTTPPATWKQSMITVLYKSGDASLPQNYRPICTIPLLYKLFARLLYGRLAPTLEKKQPAEQAGFRHDYNTEDHLFTFALLEEKAYEWQVNLWVAGLDFKKAFDTVEQECIWQALTRQGVPAPYTKLLANLYKDQTATVRTDKISKPFNITRGTKQGDPLSSLLFNALLEDIFAEARDEWHKKAWGIQLGHTKESILSNLRFADDVLLVATTLPQLAKLLASLSSAAKKRGLELHPDKTKIFSNTMRRTGRGKETHAEINGMSIQILPYEDSIKYLGRATSFHNTNATEIANRINAAWRKFMVYKTELTSKHYPLTSRIRLFDGVVTPTMLYGSSAWTLTRELEQQIQSTQRKMLRMILGTGRRAQRQQPQHQHTGTQQQSQPQQQPRHKQQQQQQQQQAHHDQPATATTTTAATAAATTTNTTTTTPTATPDDSDDDDDNIATTQDNNIQQPDEDDTTEPWTEWIQRVTHQIEAHVKKLNIEDWLSQQRRRKWRWAARIANHDSTRWTRRVLNWLPEYDEVRKKVRTRRQGHPRKRWEDDLTSFLAKAHPAPSHWTYMAATSTWDELEDEYIHSLDPHSGASAHPHSPHRRDGH